MVIRSFSVTLDVASVRRGDVLLELALELPALFIVQLVPALSEDQA
jgi:hypothetical protein